MPTTRTDDQPFVKRVIDRTSRRMKAFSPEYVKQMFRAEGVIGGAQEWERALAAYDPDAPIVTSVIIPVYNVEKYLRACLESVLSQTQSQIEIILVDDGSTDGSLEIEREFAARDPRVRLFTQPNLRQGAARNRGLREARGEYVYFMDSDDVIATTLFETCYEACQQENLEFVMFDTIGFLDKPSNYRPDLLTSIHFRQGIVSEDVCDGVTFWRGSFQKGAVPFVCWLQYFRRDFLLDNDLFFAEGIFHEDNDWIARVFLAATRIRYLPHMLHRYNLRPGLNASMDKKRDRVRCSPEIHFTLCEIGAKESRERRWVLHGAHYVSRMRLADLATIEPDDALVHQMQEFAEDLCVGFGDQEPIYAVRRWHLQALASLCQGIEHWPGVDMAAIRRGFAKALFPDLAPGFVEKKLGIYGTSDDCSRLLLAFDEKRADIVLLTPPDCVDAWPDGAPAVSIDAAGGRGIELILVADPEASPSAVEYVQCCLGDEIEVSIVTESACELPKPEIPEVMKIGRENDR